MKTTASTPKIPTYLIVKVIAYAMFVLGLGLSVVHIYGLFRLMGAGMLTAAAVPVFIDGFQLVGRLIRGEAFAEGTRRTGLVLQGVGAVVSLAANVIAGHTLGDKLAGAIFVIGYIAIEAVAERIRPAVEDAQVQAATAQAQRAAKLSAAAKKGAATRKANAAAKRAPARRPAKTLTAVA